MIPRTFPSILGALGETKMVVYVLPSVSGLQAWKDYIPVKGITTENTAVQNTYANDGYQVMSPLEDISTKQAWKDYIPVFEDASYTKAWSTDAGGYIPASGLFSVYSLFANNEQGVWYDPSDLTTLFQDAAGTTPVTAVEQPVGLMLDKSKGLVLGPELVTNGDFSQGSTGWTLGAGWTVGGGTATQAGGNVALITSSVSLTPGVAYEVRFDIIAISGGQVTPSLRGTTTVNGTGATTLGSHRQILFAATGNNTIGINSSAAFVGSIDNISVRTLPGNHAYQTTSANRPTLSARYNLLTKTEQFDDAVWKKDNTTVITNTVIAPDGTLTADKIVESATTSSHRVYQEIAPGTSTASFYAKAAGRNWVRLNFNGSNPVNFDLENGVVGSKTSGITASIISIGNGWYRCVASGNFSTNLVNYIIDLELSDNGTGIPPQSYTGDGYSGIYIWGADLRVANDGVGIPAYQRVNTATDYDTVGFPKYLSFNGSNTYLVANDTNMPTGDLSIFVGSRTDSTFTNPSYGSILHYGQAATGKSIFVNYGSDTNLGSNGFGISQYGNLLGISNSTGKATVNSLNRISTTYNLKQNGGVATASKSMSTNTAVYGTNGLAIGSYNVSLSYASKLNGRIYSIIIRGAASTTAQITNTENYVNSKTKAY